MVADVEYTEIYRTTEPAVEVGEHTAIGMKTVTVETESDSDDFIVSVRYEATDFDDAEVTVVRVDYPMLHAMMVTTGKRSLHRGFSEAFKHLKKGDNG